MMVLHVFFIITRRLATPPTSDDEKSAVFIITGFVITRRSTCQKSKVRSAKFPYPTARPPLHGRLVRRPVHLTRSPALPCPSTTCLRRLAVHCCHPVLSVCPFRPFALSARPCARPSVSLPVRSPSAVPPVLPARLPFCSPVLQKDAQSTNTNKTNAIVGTTPESYTH